MPELPEVETTRRGLAPHLLGRTFCGATIRQGRLRLEVPPDLSRLLAGRQVVAVERRAKYLLIVCDCGGLIIHLGMSGSLRILDHPCPPSAHDHIDLLLGDIQLRFRDPRRFGLVIWSAGPPREHPLLSHLGPEPLDAGFDGDHLHRLGKDRKRAVKGLIMDHRIVVGVGNIYANESLYLAGIDPRRESRRISAQRYGRLAQQIRAVLQRAIEVGGTTLRDFHHEDGKPGYFQQQLLVYGRAGEACPGCGDPIHKTIIGQRSSYFCRRCQT